MHCDRPTHLQPVGLALCNRTAPEQTCPAEGCGLVTCRGILYHRESNTSITEATYLCDAGHCFLMRWESSAAEAGEA